MLKVWREDEGESSAIEIDLGDPETAALRFAEDDVDGERDYWRSDPPVVIVEDADGSRTRFEVSATTEYLATEMD